MPQVCSITRDLGQVVLFSGPAPKVHKQRLGSLNPAFDEGVSQMLVLGMEKLWSWREVDFCHGVCILVCKDRAVAQDPPR